MIVISGHREERLPYQRVLPLLGADVDHRLGDFNLNGIARFNVGLAGALAGNTKGETVTPLSKLNFHNSESPSCISAYL